MRLSAAAVHVLKFSTFPRGVGYWLAGDNMLIRAYGLFWRCDEVDWLPGRGSRFESTSLSI